MRLILDQEHQPLTAHGIATLDFTYQTIHAKTVHSNHLIQLLLGQALLRLIVRGLARNLLQTLVSIQPIVYGHAMTDIIMQIILAYLAIPSLCMHHTLIIKHWVLIAHGIASLLLKTPSSTIRIVYGNATLASMHSTLHV